MVRPVTEEERFYNYVDLFKHEGEVKWSPYSDLPPRYFGVCGLIGEVFPCLNPKTGTPRISGFPRWTAAAVCDSYWVTLWAIQPPEEDFPEERKDGQDWNRDLSNFLGDQMMEQMKHWNREKHRVISGLY